MQSTTLFAIALLTAVPFSVERAAAAERPNLIVIMTDDMGYADLSCYGNDRYQTPHIDALAREGLRFTDYHSNGPVCSPTRAALMTGRYQQRSGIDGVVYADPARGMRDNHGLRPSEVTWAELLQQAGYSTALFGKWHLGYAAKFNPVHHGFDEFRGFVSGNVDFHTHVDQAGFADWWHGTELKDEPGYTTHLINRHALRFVEENRDGPFCLYLAHEAPHYPYQGPDDPPIREVGDVRREEYSPEHIARAYREMVQEVDKGVGDLAALLRRHGIAEKTFIFFCSDNGATANGNNGPLTGTKGTLWEGGHRVPGIAWWPGRIAAGRVTDQTALSMDLMPTLLELAGVEVPGGHQLDGVSLVPLLLDGQALPERTLFWGYNDRYAVRRGPWKLLVNQPRGRRRATGMNSEPVSLFDLSKDLSEQQDRSKQKPEKLEELQAALAAWRTDVARMNSTRKGAP